VHAIGVATGVVDKAVFSIFIAGASTLDVAPLAVQQFTNAQRQRRTAAVLERVPTMVCFWHKDGLPQSR